MKNKWQRAVEEKRAGKITIDTDLLWKQPDLIAAIFKEFLPFRASENFMLKQVEFWGISPKFQKNQNKYQIPFYWVKITKEKRSFKIEFDLGPHLFSTSILPV